MKISPHSQRRLLLKACASALLFNLLPKAQAVEPIRTAMVEGFSGSFGNAGNAVFRNLAWAVERVNERGGIKLPAAQGGPRPLLLQRYDSKGQIEEALSALRAAIDGGAQYILQGNSSAIAAALVQAIEKHNQRDPKRQVIFLNYSAIDPALTNEQCSFWHFRYDAHVNMRIAALMQVIRNDTHLQKAYLIGQDYSFGQAVLKETRQQLQIQRPDVQVVAEELHPLGRVKDFAPYASKIKASGAQAVITGNWGNDLTLLVKAAHEAGFTGHFYTFYGNALGVPAVIGQAGIGKVVAVADWLPNLPTPESGAFYKAFRQRYPQPADDYVHMRMQLMVESLAHAIEQAATTEPRFVALALEHSQVSLYGQNGYMRASDHQFQQPLVVGLMQRQGTPGVPFDVEGSGYGFKVVQQITAEQAQQPTTCQMQR